MTTLSAPGPPRRWFHRRRCFTLLAVNVVLLLLIALFFELFYRWQTLDCYTTELRAFNPEPLTTEIDTTILALGDSFTAGLSSYPVWLQERLGPRWSVVNGGIPGTSVRQAAMVLGSHLQRSAPRVVVYQTYVGNDLLDLQHPVSWRRINPLRNAYWIFNDLGWTSLGFLNYRLGQIKNRVFVSMFWDQQRSSPEQVAEIEKMEFSVDRYRSRERMLLAAEPAVLERQILVSGSMDQAWQQYSRHLESLVEQCGQAQVRLLVLVIPHCVQVDQRYRDRFEVLGATLELISGLHDEDFPFIDRLSRAVADQPHVEVLNPLRALRQAERSGQAMYLNNDAHLSLAGQQVLGRWLAGSIALEPLTGRPPE